MDEPEDLNFPLGSPAHFGPAHAYARQGDTAKASTTDQDFFSLSKDSDPEIPLVAAGSER